jgi:hypothetical protein
MICTFYIFKLLIQNQMLERWVWKYSSGKKIVGVWETGHIFINIQAMQTLV